MITEENTISSPIAFGKGGSPKFAQANRSQNRGSTATACLSPRLTKRVREPVRS